MIRIMTKEDYSQLIRLWSNTPGVGLRQLDDSLEGISKYIDRNDNTCFVYVVDNEIVGTILSGHDGRRGYIYHLAVREDCQKAGIGSKLVSEALLALRNEKINKVGLVVFNNNDGGNAFWSKLGFDAREDLVYRNKSTK